MTRSALLMALVMIPVIDSLASVSSPPQDSAITVLVVRDGSASATEIEGQLTFLANAWGNTAYSNGEPATLELVLGGQPYDVPGGLNGSAGVQIAQVKAFVNFSSGSIASLRERQAADIVIAFTSDIETGSGGATLCGVAPQNNWIVEPPGSPVFDDNNPEGLDLRGKDDFFVALVSVGPGCDGHKNRYNAAHELGHLFGGGHYDPLAGSGHEPWLLPNSRAFGYTVNGRRRVNGFVTTLATVFPSICDNTATCIRLERYSGYDPSYGSASRRNAETIDTTALSVANYMRGVPASGTAAVCEDGIDNDGDSLVDASDPDCANGDESGPPPPPPTFCDSTEMPTNVFGYLVQQCSADGISTYYRVHWSHPCPAEVDVYEIWYSQPDGVPYVYGWSRFSQLTNLFIQGAEGRARISSCGSAGCSPLSVSSFLAFDIC